MFSRTTMASSISRPIHSEAHQRERVERETKTHTARMMKVATTEIGSVSAVMTVLRQDEEQEDDDHRQYAALDDGALHAINVGLHIT